ncbi:ATP-binding protein, partial [Methanospirillum hungatei]|uniref:sensor histidine kinase n=1 Tax=Methanospirillum hungatei TaxID=2203 RepID=UPI0026ED6C8B
RRNNPDILIITFSSDSVLGEKNPENFKGSWHFHIKTDKNQFLFEDLIHTIYHGVIQRGFMHLQGELSDLFSLVQGIPDPFFITDNNREVQIWNKGMVNLTGFSADQILSKDQYTHSIPIFKNFEPILIDLVVDYHKAIRKQYEPLISIGNIWVINDYFPHLNNGKGAHLRLYASPLYDQSGGLRGAIMSAQDISFVIGLPGYTSGVSHHRSPLQKEISPCNYSDLIINGFVRENIETKAFSPVYGLSENNTYRINSFDDTEISDFTSFFYRFVETAHIPIIGWDASYAITLFNLGAARLTGISSDKVLGQKIFTLFPDSQRDRSLSLLQQVHGPEPALESAMIPIIQKSGDIRSVVWNFERFDGSDGRALLIIGVGQDITEQIWAVEYLKRYISELTEKNDELIRVKSQLSEINQHLDDIVEKRTKEIEDLLKQKDEFITQIGHDLKTPLTPVIAILPILRRKESDPKKIEYLDMAIRNAAQMHDLLISILQMARLNKSYLPGIGTSLPIREMIYELTVNFEYEILKKRLIIMNDIPADLEIRMSPIDFDTIFGNLLDNAIKFSNTGGSITFHGERTEKGIIITIRDCGIGLLPGEVEHIFEKFYKADSSRHDGKSYGLGLSITQKIVERNGGIIQVKSDGRNTGTTFTLIFPRLKTIHS